MLPMLTPAEACVDSIVFVSFLMAVIECFLVRLLDARYPLILSKNRPCVYINIQLMSDDPFRATEPRFDYSLFDHDTTLS
jgi:hypothetical protein